MKKISSKDIAVCAVAVALMFALAWLPVAAFLIPVIFVSCNYKWRHGLIVGVFAGGVTLMYSFVAGAANNELHLVIALAFIMVVPRILVGLFTSLAFWGSKQMIKGETRFKRILPYNIGASAGVITNTALVVSSLMLLFPDFVIFGLNARQYWWALVLVGLAELIVVNIIMPSLCFTVGRALKIGEFRTSMTVDENKESVEVIEEDNSGV